MARIMLRHGTFGVKDRSGRSNFSQLFIKAPMGRFFLKMFFWRVAYENIEFKDGIDVFVFKNNVWIARGTWFRLE